MHPVSEQTVLITGATDGLGKALATELARAGAAVLIHGRDDDRGHATLNEITEATGSDRLRWYRADLGELAQVRALAAAVTAGSPRLDALISNAGIGTGTPPGRHETADGIELRFAVNYLAGFLLIRLLLPTLRSSTPARIVQVSSAGQAPRSTSTTSCSPAPTAVGRLIARASWHRSCSPSTWPRSSPAPG